MLGSSHRTQVSLLPLLLLLLSVLAAPVGQAQEPLDDEQVFGVKVTAERGSAHIPYLGNQIINLTLEDISRPANLVGTAPVRGNLLLDTEIEGQLRGWQASVGVSTIQTTPGQVHQVPLNIQAGATIEEPRATVNLTIRYMTNGDEQQRLDLSFLAVAQSQAFLNIRPDGLPDRFNPDDRQQISLTIRNDNYYPDMVSFEVSAPEGWVVSPPSSITLDPGEERTIYFDVKAPQDPWFRLNPSSPTILVTAQSETSPSARYSTGVPVSISGWFLPGWVIPHIVLFFMGAIAMVRSRQTTREEKRLEKGKPHYPGLPPEDEARLIALKKTDRDKAQTMEERLQTVHVKRKEAWKERYKKRQKLEKDLAKREKERHDAVLAAQKEREKTEEERRKREEKRLAEEKRKREKKLKELAKKKAKARKRQQKAQKREEKRLQKEMEKEAKRKEKKLKELRKKKAELEKERSKDDAGPWWKPWG